MDDIFDEIEGDLRAERHRALVRRYGGVATAAALVLIAGVAGWQGWQWYQARQDRAVAGVYLTAMGDADGSLGGLGATDSAARTRAIDGFAKVAADAPAGYRTLARLREAALHADGGDLPAALALWNQVADDGSADRLLRDLASLMIAERQLDDGDPAQVRARLAPLVVPTNPWHTVAQEAQALLDIRGGPDRDRQAGASQSCPGRRGHRRFAWSGQRFAGAARRMTGESRVSRAVLRRRMALLVPLLSLSGCSLFDDLFYTSKTPLPGRREDLMAQRHGLEMSPGTPPRVTLPAAVTNGGWPQPGGNPAHVMGHLAAGDRLSPLWTSGIGEGGGYRAKITSQPVIADGRIFTMDSDGQVTAFDVATGRRIWRFDTQAEDDRSTNVGGGVAVDGGLVYASTGRAEIMTIDVASGALKWRSRSGAPARSSPTVADGRIYVSTIEQQLLALSVADGRRLWSFQATQAETTLLGQPAPAFSEGLVVAGFGSGDVVAVRAATGAVVWTDSIAATAGRTSLADLSAITGLPVIDRERVYLIGLGGLMVALDLRSGRRLWEREVGGSQTPWVAGDWVFVLTAEQTLAALNSRDGHVSWLSDLPRYGEPEKQKDPITWMGPVLVGDRLVLAGSNERALAVSPYDGKILGEQKLADKASVAPVVAGGIVFFLTDDGTLAALR